MHIAPHPPADPNVPAVRGAVVVGGGPAAVGLLLAAARSGSLRAMLAAGLTVVDRGPFLGAGGLGGYAVPAEGDAQTFLDAVRDHPLASVARLIRSPQAAALAARGAEAGPGLAEAAAFLDLVGAELARLVRDGGGRVLCGHEATAATRVAGGWRLRLRRRHDGRAFSLDARDLVIATGGEQPRERVGDEMLAGTALAARCGARLMGSDDLLRHGGLGRLARRLAHAPSPRVAVVGGSAGALSAASAILGSPLGRTLPERGLTVLHRRKLHPFYESAAAARADGFDAFGPQDVCPATGEVYRLAGMRGEARVVLLDALGIDGRSPDPRLRLHPERPSNERLSLEILAQADVVVAAAGYRPRALELREAGGRPIPLASAAPRHGVMVDSNCRVLDAAGLPLPGVFGAGPAAGLPPSGASGGEPSFRGQAEGLWPWQTAAGEMIARRLAVSDDGPPAVRAFGAATPESAWLIH